ncbi:cadherin 26 [Pelobates cultripes]|uniref:Cadherin 26 n=1 Tax=Pelobates cultripes TaxID=61616 RepID=A0AAD1SNQ6_PELCU|nr:cadherin 26 [Pelobates cultripes]
MESWGQNLVWLQILVLCTDLSLQNETVAIAQTEPKLSGKQSTVETLKRAKRAWIIDTFELQEELPGPYPKFIGRVQVEEDEQMKYKLTGIGVDEDPKGLFHINEDDGSIYVHQKINYEATPMFQWKFNAINKTSGKVGTKLGIQLKILDINDNVPQFSQKSYEVSVNESFVQGNTVFTVLASDLDEEDSLNSKVLYRIVSQMPTDSDVEFTIEPEKGFISFKGCLDYERNKKYKLVVESKDNGEDIQLSSSCEVNIYIVDRNNHLPVWNASQLQASVPERDVNVTILRFGVSDSDTPYTSAWRAVYSITEGNDDGNFIITTDPVTNEGLLTVVKPLDYETITQSQLSVLVENEEPHFSCKVMEKSKTGLWQLAPAKESKTGRPALPAKSVVVDILDVNDPPLFIPDKIAISMEEHSMEPGTVLKKVEAKDMDVVKPNKIKYTIENDTADWLTIDKDTGVITVKGPMDRESEYVVNSKYVVKILAVDDGIPSLTGTANLFVNLKDINDNAPSLENPFMATCYSEEESIISAMVRDKDLEPYAGPYHFDVLDKDYETKKLQVMNNHADVLQIRKLKDASPGNHTLHLEIYDRQGFTSLQNLTVYVCECLEGNACVEKITGPPVMGGGAVILLLLAMFVFLGLSLLVCKIHKEKEMIPVENEPLNSIIIYNEEGGNKDYINSAPLNENSAGLLSNNQDTAMLKANMVGSGFHNQATKDDMVGNFPGFSSQYLLSSSDAVGQIKLKLARSHSIQPQTSSHTAFNRAMARRHSSYDRTQRMNTLNRNGTYRSTISTHRRAYLSATNSMSRNSSRTMETILNQKFKSFAGDLEIYKPRTFVEEGELSRASSLDAITIRGSVVSLDCLENLGSKFNILEDICAEHILNRPVEKPST